MSTLTSLPTWKPRHCNAKGSLTAAASQPLGCHSSISWRWQLWRPMTLQCQQAQKHNDLADLDDSRLGKSPASFQPSVWGDFFLHYSSPAASLQEQSRMAEQADQLKVEVANMIASSITYSLHQRLHLIESLDRLCLSHLFEEEINVVLTQISSANVDSPCDIGTVSLWFYLLRKHGYRVSSDVFTRFKDEDGNFSTNNLIDILRLHNAAHLRTNGEIILDEAVLFTRRRLEEMLPYQEESLAYEIKCIFDIPLPRRVTIYESKDYISAYEKDDTMHERILQLAKLNFNIMQSHHQQELKIITRWWQDIQIESRLPFARDRVVECYLWALGVYFEPCYSRGRIILAMMFALITLFDDIYDSYATSEECEIFTKCVESWNTKYVHDLPDCMKFALGKILDSFQAIEHLLEKDEKYRMPYLKSFAVDLVRGYNVEAKMRDKHYVPKSVEEHLQLSMRTGACHLLSCASLVGIDEKATKDSFDWVSSIPKMVQALCIILRLLDDLQSYEREQLTPHVASTIDSYIKEHNVSFEEAREKIQELKEETWKDLNTGWLDPDNSQPKHIRERVFNLTRTMEFFYRHGENFTYCDNLKDTIYSLLVEPFTITV
ncbi:hypothetical protein ACP4OV_010400 [Aristida adscensionis]